MVGLAAPQTAASADVAPQVLARLRAVAPTLLTGVVFLVAAAAVVKLVLAVLRRVLARTISGESPVYRQFITTTVGLFLWFAVGLSFLSIVGLDGIATSLGTAAGFIALGVSYALSSMIADAVAGIYLLRDPDFMPGDRVTAGDTTGTVAAIELRKTRIEVDGDVVVRGNAEIERRWTKHVPDDEAPTGPDADSTVTDDGDTATTG